MWSEHGLVAWDEVEGASAQARSVALASLMRASTGRSVEAAVVEVPFGGARDAKGQVSVDRLQTSLLVAESAGWWLASLEARLHIEPRRAYPSQWRSELGFPPAERDVQKDVAVRLVDKVCRDLDKTAVVGPRGGTRVDASEAICISMVSWMWRFGITGALRSWKDTGIFGGKRASKPTDEGGADGH